MKLLSTLFVLAIVATSFLACKSDGDAARDAAVQEVEQGMLPATDPAAAPAPGTPEPAQNAQGVWHYTCPKGCEGGAGSAVACAKCGTTLAHNAAYHPPTNATPQNSATSLPAGITPVTDPTATQKAPEPAQNAKGVWHYTCSSGCAGGAGSAIACAKCGKTLAHNASYHQ